MLKGVIETLVIASAAIIAVCWAFCLMAALRRSMTRLLEGASVWRLQRVTFAMLGLVAVVATSETGKNRSAGTETTGVSPATDNPFTSDWDSRHPGGGVRSGESDATLRFESIDVHSNDTATLRLAWPLDLIPTNTTIDLLVDLSQYQQMIPRGDAR